MKTLSGLLLSFILFQFIFIKPILAFEVKDKNEYLVDIRGDDGDIYLNRLSLHKKWDSSDIEVSGFGELQWNFQTSEWEKLMLGTEIGRYMWQYLYIGQSLQLISGEILDYMAFDTDTESIDTTTKISLTLPLIKYFYLHLFEEYSLNIEKGRDESCDVGTEIIYKVRNLYSVSLGWRHTDRIHNFDTDYASISFTLNF